MQLRPPAGGTRCSNSNTPSKPGLESDRAWRRLPPPPPGSEPLLPPDGFAAHLRQKPSSSSSAPRRRSSRRYEPRGESAGGDTVIVRSGWRLRLGWDRGRPAPVAALLAPSGPGRPVLEDRDAVPAREESPRRQCSTPIQALTLRSGVAREFAW